MRITIDTDAKTFTFHGEVNVGEFLNFIQKNFPVEIVDNWTILNEKELEQEVEWPKPYTPYPTNPWPWTNPTPSPYTPEQPWPITPIYCTLSNDPRWSQFATKS